jgi:hypothetical protein
MIEQIGAASSYLAAPFAASMQPIELVYVVLASPSWGRPSILFKD